MVRAGLDILAVAFALLVGVVIVGVGSPAVIPQTWAWDLDLSLGAVLALALPLRRPVPRAFATMVALACLVSMTAVGALLVSTYRVVQVGRGRAGALIALLGWVAVCGHVAVIGHSRQAQLSVALTCAAILIAALATGAQSHNRAQRTLALRERAERAEREQQSRVEQARAGERLRIARELHDVLAHRLSVVSVQAGALEYNASAAPELIRESAGAIRANAHQALEEMRLVIGVLRADEVSGTTQTPTPQPTLSDVDSLVAQARDSGQHVTLSIAVDGMPSAAVGRTAYRVVQEGLTNARKHAPGSTVEVHIDGTREAGLTVGVVNTPATPGGDVPGFGVGLIGLRERVDLLGGRLQCGPQPAGGYRVGVELPWTPLSLKEDPAP